MTEPRYRYFLAHASPDKPFVREVFCALSNAPVEPGELPAFLDEGSTAPRWDQAIPLALSRSRAIVVFVSRRYPAAWYLAEEVQRAIAYARDPARATRVIPVYLDGWPRSPEDVPYGLYVAHAIDGAGLSPATLAAKLVALDAPPGQPEPIQAPAAVASDEQLYDAACALLAPQLEKLLKLTLRAPVHELRHGTRAEQVVDVISWANNEAPAVRAKLEAELRRLAPARFPR